ncbi:MAG: efflux RND transporter permease subunit [Gemmatimonadota bacterium]|nr:efflux RND transporter permease subunit [Gemmatimonadota bacterium]
MVRFSIRRPIAVSMAYLAVALLGVAAWRGIPIELLPETDLPQLSVSAEWGRATPEAMEAFVTAPLEAAVQQVRGVEEISSISSEQFGQGRSQLTVKFARGTDMDFARLDLSERLSQVEEDLPEGVIGPRVEPYVPQEFREQRRPFLRYTLTGPFLLEALRAHVDDQIEPELLQLDGVAGIEAYGGRDRVLEVVLDENRINALGLRPRQVWQRILDLEYVSEAGVVAMDGMERMLAIRHRIDATDDIREAVLLSNGGRLVRVKDVAIVHDTYEEPQSLYRIDGQPAVAFQVHKEVGINTVKVADRVKAKVTELEASLPPGSRLLLDDDESEAIRKALNDLRIRALIAAAVVFVVLLVFLRSFRSAGIVFATIAFSILIALNLIYFGGLSLNVLTLMGLAMGFGLIVDNAIVVLENIYRKWQKGEEKQRGSGAVGQSEGAAAAVVAAEEGAREVGLPILAATATTVIVFLPFLYLQGELRDYYIPFAVVVGMSLVASLFVAFTFIPALAAKLLGGGRAGGRADGLTVSATPGAPARRPAGPPFYVRLYAVLLRGTLRWPLITAIIALAVLGGSYRVFDKYVTRGVLWRAWWGEQTYISILIRLPRGEELDRTDELARFFEEKLKHTPEVERYVTSVQPQYAFLRVTFPDSLENTQIPPAIKEQLVAYSYLFGGAEVRVYGYGPSFYGGGSAPPNYSIKVLGYNYEAVRDIAEDLGRRLLRFSRIRDVDVNSAGGWYTRDKASEFTLALDRERLGVHGLTAEDVVYQIAAAIRGSVQRGFVRVGGDELRFDVKLEGSDAMDADALPNLLIQAGDGRMVRLGDVGEVREREVLSRIERENQQYQRYVSYEFRGPSKLGDRTRDAVIASTRLPDGYSIEGEDDWRWDEEEQRQIWIVLGISLLLIYMVTAALFESVIQPFVVLLTVPMALVGVFLIFYFTDASFTREAWIGVITMGGIVVNNAILLVDHVNQLRRRHGIPLRDATIQGTLERVRPILMTSCTTILGLLPLVLFSESADANIWNALGLSLIGGLTSSMVLVLTVTPALYLLAERRGERRSEAARQRGSVAALVPG